MSTVNISIPAVLKAFVDEQVSQQGYGSSSEYVRALIRKDQDRRQLHSLLLEGARSAPTQAVKPNYFDRLRDRVRKSASGSPRYAHELNLPGLTTWLLTPYPHLVFSIIHYRA